jgi:hypothetical protein
MSASELRDSKGLRCPRPLLPSLFPDLTAHQCSYKLKGKEHYEHYRFYAYGDSKNTVRNGSRGLVKAKEIYQSWSCSMIFCSMCGSRDAKTLRQHSCLSTNNGLSFFCQDTDCMERYRYCAFNYYDLSYGIPYLWKVEARRNPRLYHPVPDDNTKPRCAYCNECDENIVVYHPLILSWFQHNAFCKNSICCKQYISFVENVPRIPFVFEPKSEL